MSLQQSVKDYYGKTLSTSSDLKTDACCTLETQPPWMSAFLENVRPEVRERYYGCGLVAPLLLEGARVLDLGCGAGRDVYLLAQAVGATGEVIGIDMTPEQLAVAARWKDAHAETFGFDNVRFMDGDIERLPELDLDPSSFDVVISNCVINLVADKEGVLRAVFDLLKPGGEFYFADIYADRRIDEALLDDPIARGECLSGALYWNDFLQLAKRAGFKDPRLFSARDVAIQNEGLKAKLSPTRFTSAVYRLFRADGLEQSQEDFGATARYLGDIPFAPDSFALDEKAIFATGVDTPVSANTLCLLKQSRFAAHFALQDGGMHLGAFSVGSTGAPFSDLVSDQENKSCC